MAAKPRRSEGLFDAISQSAVLVTSASVGVRDSGSGFCIQNAPDGITVATCSHVIYDLTPGQGGLHVNGREAVAVVSADDRGVDLAILRVPGCNATPVNLSGSSPKPDMRFWGVGFVHLHGSQCVSTCLSGTVSQLLTMRAQLSRLAVPSLLLLADEDGGFAPGNSGAAIFDENGEVIGILAFASRDGRKGYALSVAALKEILPETGLVGAATEGPAHGDVTRKPLPPELGTIQVIDDLQKNRFGGSASDGQVELVPVLRRVSGRSYFTFDISVRPVRPGLTLLPPARFFLHDTFPRSIIQITRSDDDGGGFTLYEVHSYGVFTVGCQVFASDDRWHSVEFDLVNLPRLPSVFRSR